jgi:hypothetical protein
VKNKRTVEVQAIVQQTGVAARICGNKSYVGADGSWTRHGFSLNGLMENSAKLEFRVQDLAEIMAELPYQYIMVRPAHHSARAFVEYYDSVTESGDIASDFDLSACKMGTSVAE